MNTILKAYPRVMWGLSVALVISAIGESFLWPLTTAYIVESFGKTLHVAALVLMLQYTGTLIGNIGGGLLFDKWSGRKTVLTAIGLAILLLVFIGSSHNFPLYCVLLFLLGICQGSFWPSSRAFAALLWPEGGRTGMNMMYVANNIGVAVGAAFGGLVASHSFRMAFYGNAVTYGLFLLIFLNVIKERVLQAKRLERLAKQQEAKLTATAATAATAAIDPIDPIDTTASTSANTSNAVPALNSARSTTTTAREWVSLGVLMIGLMLFVITYSQWQTTISNYVISLGIHLSAYSVLWAVNGLVIVLFQPLLSWLIRRYALSLKAQILIGGCFFALAMLVITVSSLYAAFVLGMVIVTWGEMVVWPAVPTIAAEMAPVGREGFFQGMAMTGQSIGRMLGPLVGSLLYEAYSPHTMLCGMIVLAVLGWVSFFYYDRLQKRPRTVNMTEHRALMK